MRIALCQCTSTPDPKANLEAVASYAERVADAGATLAVFPEAMMCRFGVPLRPVAEPLDGPWATAVNDIATRHGLTILAGMFTPADEGRVRNTLLLTGTDRHLGYDKIHLFDAFGFAESDTVAPGSELVVVEFGDITLGLAICYDVRFPELFRALADRGANVMALPASWGSGPGKREQWELLVRARALDSTSWVLACGQADPGDAVTSKAPTGIGYSLVADPFGRVAGSLAAAPDLLVVDIDPATVDTARAAIPVLANRRL
ncbi:MAG TPA: carbon-nitrogen hydrolase family protein [Pseudonocardiaceae bacterium]